MPAEASLFSCADHLLPGGYRGCEPANKRRKMKERYNCRRCGQLKRGHVCSAPAIPAGTPAPFPPVTDGRHVPTPEGLQDNDEAY
jgi:hypothetical protein